MSRATENTQQAALLLRAAALFVPEGVAKNDLIWLAGRCEGMVRHILDAEDGRKYTCVGCGVTSEYPLGAFDAHACGPCHNKGVRSGAK